MKRVNRWLKTKLCRPTVSIITDRPTNRVSVKPDDIAKDDYEIESLLDAEVPAYSQEPGKNVLMPDICANEHVAIEPDLKILDQSSPTVDKSTGFNPYDTDVL